MRLIQLNLLRRTAVALAAVAGFSIAAPSQAAVITLTNATGNSCSYSSMSVAPDGSFNVACTAPPGGGTPTPTTCQPNCTSGGSFSFSQTTASAPANAQLALFINRNGGTGAVNLPITFTGNCSYSGAASVMATFADGQGVLGFYASTGSDGTCTVGFGAPTMVSGTVDNVPTASGTVVVTVGNGGVSPPVQAPPGTCPTGFSTPVDLANMTLGGLGNPILAMAKSNQVVSMPLPATSAGSTGVVAFSESAGGAYTPQPVTLQISINKCPGLIDTDPNNRCNMTSTNGNYNSVTWFSKAYSVINGAGPANARGYCWAGDADKYYVNARWTYSQCAFGASVCGFAVQQNLGPY